MNPLSDLFGNSNDETNFPHKLLLINTQVSEIYTSANLKFSITQLSKIIRSRRFIFAHTYYI